MTFHGDILPALVIAVAIGVPAFLGYLWARLSPPPTNAE